MAKQRYINTKFWSDTYVDTLDPIEKLLFLYLLTNERTNVAGVFELPMKIIAVESGIERNMVDKILTRFESEGKIKRYKGYIRLMNSDKHQNTDNIKIIKGIKRIKEEIGDEIIGYLYPMHETSHLDLNSNLDLDLNLDSNSDLQVPKYSDEDIRLAELLKEKVQENFPMKKELKISGWYDEFRKLRELDLFSTKEIETVIFWVHGGGNFKEHHFWSANIRSAGKLRKQMNTLVAQMQQEYKKSNGIINTNKTETI